MKTVNLRAFRTYYREKIKEQPLERNDEHFVGTSIRLPGSNRTTFGFFELYHGDKEDIRTYLPSLLKIAEDEQAFYEFAQNAVDAQSTHFWAFYNERYFIVLNNGEPFNFEGLRSILNIAQSTKKERCDKIGRFGIGFKLVHRLVGKGDGNHELLEKYKGPVLFSWHRPEQLQSLINGEEVQFAEEQTADNLAGTFADYPLLTKILLTNFPAGVGESVKNLDHEDFTPFSHEEYAQMCAALQEVTRQYRLDFSPFSQGSLFFIDLGENKHELLKRNEEDLRIGMEYSMNFLKKLENIRINECYLHRKEILTEHFTIKTDEALFREIEPESKECDIHIAFGYHKQEEYEDKSKVDYIKQSPNFYKFFPMGDETNKFAFILHSDAFGMEANRRKMQNDHVNRHLLPAFADMLEKRMDQLTQTEEGYERYRAIFLSILLSESPEEQRNEWYKNILYIPLLDAIKQRVPTTERQTLKNSELVKIKDTQLQIQPAEWGAADANGRPYFWFAWEYHRGSHIIKYARERLDLERWDALDLIRHGEVRQINIQLNVKPENREILWQELLEKSESDFSDESLKDKLRKIYLFYKAEGDEPYSLEKLSKSTDILLLPHQYAGLEEFKQHLNLECILLNEEESRSDFFKIVIKPSLPYLEDSTKLKELLFDGEHILKKICDLSLPLRRDYVLWLKRVNLCKIDDLREKAIFENRRGERLPLSKMLLPSEETPDFLKPFEIHPDAFSADFKRELLHKAEDIYTHLLFERWEDITQGIIDSAGNDTEATISKLVALYEYTPKTHKQAKEEAAQANRIPNLPDFKNTDKAYILDYDGTLRGENEIYYNAQLSRFHKEKGKEAYEQLHVFVSQHMNVALPHPQMLRFLREPFGTTPLAFEEWGWEKLRQCSTEIIDTLFNLLEYQEKDLFQYFVLAEVSGGYQLHQRHDSSYLNYISGYDAEKQYIRDYHDDILYAVPQAYESKAKASPHVLQGESLGEKLVDLLPQNEIKQAARLLSSCKLSMESTKRLLCKKINHLGIDYTNLTTLTQTSPELILIKEYAGYTHDPSITEAFREAFILAAGNTEYTIDAVPIQNTVRVEYKEDNSYEFAISELLPERNQEIILFQEVVQYIAHVFKPSGQPSEEQLKKLFNFKTGADIDHELIGSVIRDLKHHHDGVVQNATQLAFLLLVQSLFPEKDYLSDLKVETLKGVCDILSCTTYYVQPLPFIDEDKIVSTRYIDLSNKIPLPLKVSLNKVQQNISIYWTLAPFLREDGSLHIPYVKEPLSDKEQEALWDFLLDTYRQDKIHFKSCPWNNYASILGFKPSEKIFFSDHEKNTLIANKEHLPETFLNWLNKLSPQERISFISHLKINNEDCKKILIRSTLTQTQDIENETALKNYILESPQNELYDTLMWFFEKKPIVSHSKGAQLVESIVQIYNEKIGSKNFEIITQYHYNNCLKNSEEAQYIFYKEDFKIVYPMHAIYFVKNDTFYKCKIIKDIQKNQQHQYYIFQEKGNESIACFYRIVDNNKRAYTFFIPWSKKGSMTWIISQIQKFNSDIASALKTSWYRYEGMSNGNANSFKTLSPEEQQKVGKEIEKKVYEKLLQSYPNNYYEIIWNNKYSESTIPYDLAVYEKQTNKLVKRIECKAQSLENPIGLFLSKNQWQYCLNDLKNQQYSWELWVGYYVKLAAGIKVRYILRLPSHALFHPSILFRGFCSMAKTSMMDEHGFGDDTEKIKVELNLEGLRELYNSTPKPDFDVFEFK